MQEMNPCHMGGSRLVSVEGTEGHLSGGKAAHMVRTWTNAIVEGLARQNHVHSSGTSAVYSYRRLPMYVSMCMCKGPRARVFP